MDEATRNQIAEALDRLAAQHVWNDEVWQRCYDLVSANTEDEVVAFVMDDLIHCSAIPLVSFPKPPVRPEFDKYKQQFRDVAQALRDRLSLAETRQKYGL